MNNDLSELQRIRWTDRELERLIEDDCSCVNLIRAKKCIGLPPSHFADDNIFRIALIESMRKYLYRYDRVLEGLLITYRNGKYLGCSADMVNGLLEMQCNIEADFYIFQPKVGERLRGRVKEVTADYIELVIHKGINATIPKPLFSDELWIGDTLSINQKVLFTPTIIDLRSYSLDIQGTFNETYEHNFEYEKNLILSSESESDSEEQDEKEESECVSLVSDWS